jgi:hypothetical protein
VREITLRCLEVGSVSDCGSSFYSATELARLLLLDSHRASESIIPDTLEDVSIEDGKEVDSLCPTNTDGLVLDVKGENFDKAAECNSRLGGSLVKETCFIACFDSAPIPTLKRLPLNKALNDDPDPELREESEGELDEKSKFPARF